MRSSKVILSFVLVLIFSLANVLAFAVSIPPLPEKDGNPTVYLMPGESKVIRSVAQNGGGATSDLNIIISISEGSDVARILDLQDQYNIPAGGRVDVNFEITIPEDAQLGDSFPVTLSFTTAPVEGSSSFGSSIGKKFNVFVGEEPKESPAEEEGLSDMAMIILGILVLLVVIGLIRKFSKK